MLSGHENNSGVMTTEVQSMPAESAAAAVSNVYKIHCLNVDDQPVTFPNQLAE